MNIQLRDVIELRQISKWEAWATEVTITVFSGARFELGAEGIALAYLRTWVVRRVPINVLATFHPSASNEFGGFGSLFGLYLTYVASSISTPGANGDIRDQLTTDLWRYATDNDGVIGNAKQRWIIFRDPDYLIPKCMQDIGDEGFPYVDKFQEVLIDQTRRLGVDPHFASLSAQRDIVTFVYQASRNAYEHGRPNDINQGLVGIRGVTIQKLIFATEEAVRRRSCSLSALKDFLWQNWSNPKNRRKAFLAVTVCDLGDGIHETLPAVPNEGAEDRLKRAIFTNASRKPKADEVERGQGLPYIVESAQRLRAFLLVNSADLTGFLDFSESTKYPTIARRLNMVDEFRLSKPMGTSITLVWPVGEEGGEQFPLIES